MTTINYLTTIQFDFGALQVIPSEAGKLGIRRPLIVTDRGVRAAGLLERLTGGDRDPTTAGTGSEVGRGSLIVMKSGRKLGLLSPYLLPKLAICDPELTMGLPPTLTAATGLDAIAHCIETFLSAAVNPPAGAIVLDGLRRAIRHVERATFEGHDCEARWNMMMAATEGAMAFQKGLGAVHALSHPLGAIPELQLHHGMLNAVLLPAVLRFNEPAVGPKMSALSDAMGCDPAEHPADAIVRLNKRLGLPSELREMGVARGVLGAIAQAATEDH
jgi:4-hydroxybutyrate dehydrogenase